MNSAAALFSLLVISKLTPAEIGLYQKMMWSLKLSVFPEIIDLTGFLVEHLSVHSHS